MRFYKKGEVLPTITDTFGSTIMQMHKFIFAFFSQLDHNTNIETRAMILDTKIKRFILKGANSSETDGDQTDLDSCSSVGSCFGSNIDFFIVSLDPICSI